MAKRSRTARRTAAQRAPETARKSVPSAAPSSPPAPEPEAGPRVSPLIPLAIFALALLLRAWGIDWGLPNAGRLFSYHPDESVVVSYSYALNPFALRLDPGFYNYGSLSLLINSFFIRIGEIIGLVGGLPVPNVPIPPAGALLTARMVAAVLGAATCLFLYGTGRRLYSPGAGLFAAGLYAVAPLAVQHGHFATVDVPATFWLSGALYFAARYQESDARPDRDMFWAGLWSGLAAATKYNAGLVLLAGVAAWWLGGSGGRRRRSGLAWLIGGAAGGFIVGCPGVFLNPAKLLEGIALEAQHVREGHGLVFVDTLPAFLHHWVENLRWGLGLPLMLLAAAGLAHAVARRRPADLILLAFALPYYLLISLAAVKFARYTLPLFPPLLLLTAALATEIGRLRGRPVVSRVIYGAGGAAAVFALLLGLALDRTMTRTDPRDQAAAFIRSSGFASVGFATGPWFYSPPLHPMVQHFNPAQAKQAAAYNAPLLIPADGEWNAGQLETTAPAAIVLSELNEYADALRTKDGKAMAYINAVRRNYPNHRVFVNPVKVFGIPFTNLSGEADLPVQGLPHDMLYTNPTTVVFYR